MFSQTRRFSTFFPKVIGNAHILHITDSEGTKFFIDAVSKSKFLKYHPDSGLDFHHTKGIPYFIFGGDATDRGPHDLETTELLLDFKTRHPQNVFLLAGNREIKNTRFKELDPLQIRQRLLNTTSPYWVQTTPRTYVKDLMEKDNKSVDEQMLEYYLASLSVKDCQLLYLRWMLEKTMGSPHAFRYRREELKRRSGKIEITPEEVLQSFISETKPDGLMGRYLQQSQLGVIIPDTTVLAVHGGLTAFNVGRIPGKDYPVNNAHQWIAELNEWFRKQIKLWIDSPSSQFTEAGRTALDTAVLPIPGKPKYVVTADMLSTNREIIAPDPIIIEYLKKNNLSVVLHGHQPAGDHPLLLREDNILFVNGDTGYAAFHPEKPDDTRGLACHSLDLQVSSQQTSVSIIATLANGENVKTHLVVGQDGISGDEFIGKLLPSGELVQCQLPGGNYRLLKQEGFNVTYSDISVSELALKMQVSECSDHRGYALA